MPSKKTDHETFASALAAAQANMSNPPLDGVNPHFKSRYATLSAIRDAVIPPLAEQGIACVQSLSSEADGRVTCSVTLLWRDCTMTFSSLSAKPDRQNSQAVGSVATYLRRYTLSSVLSVCGDADDDGNASMPPRNGGGRAPAKAKPAFIPLDLDESKLTHRIGEATTQQELKSLVPELKKVTKRHPAAGQRLRDAYGARIEQIMLEEGDQS